MNEASLMDSANCFRKPDRDPQKDGCFQRTAEQLIERFAAGILEHQRRAVVVTR